jgi:hypothetical protein
VRQETQVVRAALHCEALHRATVIRLPKAPPEVGSVGNMALPLGDDEEVSSRGSTEYANYIAEQVAREDARQKSFEARATSVVTTSGVLATLLLGFATLTKPATGGKSAGRFVLPQASHDWVRWALIAFAAGRGRGRGFGSEQGAGDGCVFRRGRVFCSPEKQQRRGGSSTNINASAALVLVAGAALCHGLRHLLGRSSRLNFAGF